MKIANKEQFKDYVVDFSKNNTCQRPDISIYEPCDNCPYTEYCLCDLNTKFNDVKIKRKYR